MIQIRRLRTTTDKTLPSLGASVLPHEFPHPAIVATRNVTTYLSSLNDVWPSLEIDGFSWLMILIPLAFIQTWGYRSSLPQKRQD